MQKLEILCAEITVNPRESPGQICGKICVKEVQLTLCKILLSADLIFDINIAKTESLSTSFTKNFKQKGSESLCQEVKRILSAWSFDAYTFQNLVCRDSVIPISELFHAEW